MTDSIPAGLPAAVHGRSPANVLRIVLAYAVFAGLWILVSDKAVGWLFSDPARIILASTIKGWLFVAVTSLLLYGLIRRLLDQALSMSRRELDAQTEKARALQLLDAIVESSTDAIFAKDLEGRYLMVNRETARVLGKTPEQILGHDDSAIFPVQQAAAIRANDRRVIAENRTDSNEETLTTADGEVTYLTTKGPLRDAAGQVIGMFGIARDITDFKRADAALREQSWSLAERNDELERFNRVMVGRELEMINLKQQVNALSLKLGLSAPFALAFAAASTVEAGTDSSAPAAGAPG